jgi:hypothetical protein
MLKTAIAVFAGTLLVGWAPAVAFAESHGGRSSGSHGFSGRSSGRFEGGAGRSVSPRYDSGRSGSWGGGQSFVAPHSYESSRGYFGGRYVAPRYYGPAYRGYYGGGLYLGFGAPYVYGYGYPYAPGYVYDPGYAYDPSYSYGAAPATPPACSPGSYDQYGNWIPNPNCAGQQQYGPVQGQPSYPPQGQPGYPAYPNQQPYPSGGYGQPYPQQQ